MNDPYLYKGTNILKNKFNIKDIEILEKAEKEITSVNMELIRRNHIKGKYDYEHFKKVHEFIFGDIYEWAGEQRTIDIEKSELVLNGLMFKHSSIENIEKEINQSLKELNEINWVDLYLDEKSKKFSRVISDVWKSHAFREGNTRTTITFFTQFAEEKGFPLKAELLRDNSKYVRDSLVASAYEDKEIDIERNFSYLEKIIKHAIKDGQIEKNKKMTLEDKIKEATKKSNVIQKNKKRKEKYKNTEREL